MRGRCHRTEKRQRRSVGQGRRGRGAGRSGRRGSVATVGSAVGVRSGKSRFPDSCLHCMQDGLRRGSGWGQRSYFWCPGRRTVGLNQTEAAKVQKKGSSTDLCESPSLSPVATDWAKHSVHSSSQGTVTTILGDGVLSHCATEETKAQRASDSPSRTQAIQC